ncbi:MAG: hypothetical protein RIT81_07450 [Deltaproteobacteria bacterium]
MFSDAWVQELVALVVAGIAFVYMVHKITGWPRRKKPTANVVMGSRLERGLKNANKRDCH